MRLEDESRWPRTLTLLLRINSSRLTKQTPMMHRDECKSPEDLSSLVKKVLFDRDLVRDKKVFFIGMSVSKFENLSNIKSIGYFFTKNETDKELLEAVDEDGLNLYYKCLDCGKVMERKERSDHDDFHYAKKLSFETNLVKYEPTRLGDRHSDGLDESGEDHKEPVDGVKEESIKDLLEAVDSNGINLYHKCLECGEILEQGSRQEHQDFHYAFKISKDFKTFGDDIVSRKNVDERSRSITPNNQTRVKKKSKFQNSGPSIKSFFKRL